MKNIYQKVIGEKIDTYYMDFNLTRKINDDHIAIMLAVYCVIYKILDTYIYSRCIIVFLHIRYERPQYVTELRSKS